MIEEITFDKRLYAIIIRNKFSKNGAYFATKSSLSQQMAHMKYKKVIKLDLIFIRDGLETFPQLLKLCS